MWATALLKNGYRGAFGRGPLWASPLISLVGLGDESCTARDKSPAAPDRAGDFPSSPRPRARGQRALTQGTRPECSLRVLPGARQTSISDSRRGLYQGTNFLRPPSPCVPQGPNHTRVPTGSQFGTLTGTPLACLGSSAVIAVPLTVYPPSLVCAAT